MNDIAIPAADRSVTASHNRPTIPVLTKMELLEDYGEFMRRKADLIAKAGAIPTDVTAWTQETVEACTSVGRDVLRFKTDVENTRTALKQPYGAIATAIDDFFNKEMRDGIVPTASALSKLAGAHVDHRAALEAKRLAEEAVEKKRLADEVLASAAAAEDAGQHTRAEIKTEQAMLHEQRAQQIETRIELASHQDLGRTTSVAGTMTGTRKLTRTIDRDKVDLEALRPFLAYDAIEKAVIAYDGINSNKLAVNKRDLDLKKPLKGVEYKAETTGTFR